MSEQPKIIVLPDGKLAYTLPEFARLVPYGYDTLLKAARKGKDDGVFPPPLRAKGGRNDAGRKIVVLATEGQRWLERLPDY